MDNLIENKIPYSAEAVNNLISLERIHLEVNSNGGFQSGWCDDCFPPAFSLSFDETPSSKLKSSCPTLITAREGASKETLIAVALILSEEKS